MLDVGVAVMFVTALAGIGPFVASAGADVVDSAANGFTVHIATSVDAPAARVYDTLVTPSAWWASDHTFSGSAANLTVDPAAGGCWCEKLPNGSVEHLRVVFVDRGKALHLRGALGPLQTVAAAGAMTIDLKETRGSTTVDVTYTVGGYVNGGFEPIAKGVDAVLAAQLARLKKAVETGKPE